MYFLWGKETIERYLKWEACNCLSEETWACLNHFLCTVHRFGKPIHRVHHFWTWHKITWLAKGISKQKSAAPFFKDISVICLLQPKFRHHMLLLFSVFLERSPPCLLNRYSAWDGASKKLSYFWSSMLPSSFTCFFARTTTWKPAAQQAIL